MSTMLKNLRSYCKTVKKSKRLKHIITKVMNVIDAIACHQNIPAQAIDCC